MTIIMINIYPALDGIKLLLIVGVLVVLAIDYTRTRYKAVAYLIFSLLFFAIAELMNNISYIPDIGFYTLAYVIALSVLSMDLGLFMLHLFFTTFEEDNVFTKVNKVNGIFILVMIPLLMYNLVLMKPAIYEIIQAKQQTPGAQPQVTVQLVFISFLITTILVWVQGVYLLIYLYYRMIKKYRKAQNPLTKIAMRNILIAVGIMTVGQVINFVAFEGIIYTIGTLTLFTGIGLLVYFYKKSGIKHLQDYAIQRVLIVHKSGVPVYGFSFQNQRHEAQDLSLEEEDVLFSGGLRAIMSLIGEYLGKNQALKEIVFNEAHLLVQPLNNEYSLIVLTEKRTKYLENSIQAFAEVVKYLVEDISEGEAFKDEQVKVANDGIALHFGVSI